MVSMMRKEVPPVRVVLSLSLLLLLSDNNNRLFVSSHGTMVYPTPRQPESVYWYQVGCLIGCKCSGGGKEQYPSPESMDCESPARPTLTSAEYLTWNIGVGGVGNDDNGSAGFPAASIKKNWNQYMPWRSPGSSIPIDSCGIASGFDPNAKVQYPAQFSTSDGVPVPQGTKGTELPKGTETVWESGSIVEAAFHLTVNHGGGYQYRVCPTSSSSAAAAAVVVDEECFHSNPLPFADDKHTVVLMSNDKGHTNITIDAVDVTEGVHPKGHEWRKLPIPACSCDLGTSCRMNDGSSTDSFFANKDDTSSTISYATPKGPAYGDCTTGLQFDAPHLHNGVWPEGYGYHISNLGEGGSTQQEIKQSGGGGKTNDSFCDQFKDETACVSHYCAWYSSDTKLVCYDGGDLKLSEGNNTIEEEKKEGIMVIDVKCSSFTDQPSCEEYMNSQNHACTWYEGSGKAVCYDDADQTKKQSSSVDCSNPLDLCYDANKKGESKKSSSSSKETEYGDESYNWMIVDKLIAPKKEGTYILQWRWDNEQTPQIWTTCSDIRVVNNEASVVNNEGNNKDNNDESSSYPYSLIPMTMMGAAASSLLFFGH